VQTCALPIFRPTAGNVWVRDRPQDPDQYSVRKAHDLRIETVHQGQTLGEKQPLWRNLFVGRQITGRFGFIDVKKEKEIADQLLRRAIGFRGHGITADSTVLDLSGASARASPSRAPCTSRPTSSCSMSPPP